MQYGSQSEVGKVRSILLKHPRDAYIDQESVAGQWKELNYSSCPDYREALSEYDRFVDLLGQEGAEIQYLPVNRETGLDSLYVHDPVIITQAGAILCNMGKEMRRGEPTAVGHFLSALDIPILGSITGEGRLEGGDVVWLDERTIAVGQGYRTNAEGIRQLKALTDDLVDEFVVVPLVHWNGPEYCLHLMSMISPVDRDLAVVYSRLMPVSFRNWLLSRGMHLLEVPDSEYASMACNVLAIAPRKCIMLSGNPQTRQMLEENGVKVHQYTGDEISRKGAGGPTCLTRPLLREQAS